MVSSDVVQWLLNSADAPIRFQVIVDLLQEHDVGKVSEVLDDLHNCSLVAEWLNRLEPGFGMKQLHSSEPTSFENVMGRLGDLGMRAGLQPFDSKTLPFRAWLTDTENDIMGGIFRVFLRTIVASFLSYTGYSETDPVHNVLKDRLKWTHSFASNPDFMQVYVDERGHSIPPDESEEDSIVNPELYRNQKLVLPWIHDIRAFAFSVQIHQEPELMQQAEEVVAMILTPDYQSLQPNYGRMRIGDRFYKIGWNIHLPGFFSEPSESEMSKLLLTMEMMAPFKSAQESDWFKQMMALLESYETDDGTYIFPRAWMPEDRSGYWVNGAYMALEDNRKKSVATECESTFRMLKIKHLMGNRI
ncbi:MAG: hypothetical protein ACFFD6_05870 [Candidatus Thorarchaeota archaeon]